MTEFTKKELKRKFTNIQEAFKSFNKIELKGRKHIQEAILGCYDIYLHYNEKLIKKRCKKAGIKYKVKKPMKMILMLCLALVRGVGMCAAEKPANKKTVTTVFTTDIDCEHCVKKIMNNVPSLGKGVKDVQVDLPKKEVTVVYDGTKNNDENIVKGFASLKVKAEPKKAGAKK